jgi:hypothetical protein
MGVLSVPPTLVWAALIQAEAKHWRLKSLSA